MEVFNEFGISATDWKAKQRQRVKDMIRKAQERAEAYRPALVVIEADTQPKRVVFDTPHGRAYRVTHEQNTGVGVSRMSITLPYIAGYTE